MEGTPQLLTDVKFTQLRKGGYDPEEVDNYLERINDAVAKLADNLREANERAESAQAQLADARRAQADAEAELERIRGGGVGTTSSGASADEELAKVLVLAQRAADQAVEEANEAATKTVADARAKAVNLLADAEQERERLLAKAHKKADAVAEERGRALGEQVAALSAAKADLEADVAALAAHLELERDRLRDCIESVRTALDDPEGLRLAPSPELFDTPIPAIDLPSALERPSPFTPLADEPLAASGLLSDTATLPELPDAGSDVVEVTPIETGIDEGADARGGESDRSSTIFLEGTDRRADEDTGPTTDEADEALFEDREDRLDREDREGDDAAGSVDAGPPAELFADDEHPDEHPLGQPDEEADAAMRAFFERDFDDPAEATTTARGRFGRRR